MIGHIKIDRKIQKWEWYQNSKMVHIFIHLLINANHQDGSWQGKPVKRGQFITGRLKLAATLNMSEREIRTCLSKLKKTGEISIITTKTYSLITICKYGTYQESEKNKRPTERPTERPAERPARSQHIDQQTTTNNNDTITLYESTPNAEIKNSNLFRQPNIPNWQDVLMVFKQNGGSELMAKSFFETNESVGWFLKGSPITSFRNLVPKYISTWKTNEANSDRKNGNIDVTKTKITLNNG